jgi:hypothetical protein
MTFVRFTADGTHLKIPNTDVLQVVVNSLTHYSYSSATGGFNKMREAADEFCRGNVASIVSLIEQYVCRLILLSLC